MAGGAKKLRAQIIDEKGNKIQELEQTEFNLDVYSPDNMYSVFNMVPELMKNNMKLIPEELKDMEYEEIRKIVKPSATLNQLRIRFWYAYDEALYSGRKIGIASIAKGVCNDQQFKRIIKDPEKLSYILTPVTNYAIAVQDLMETSIYKMREALEKIDIQESKDLNAILKIYEVFDKRTFGDYKKKVEITDNTGIDKDVVKEQLKKNIAKDLI